MEPFSWAEPPSQTAFPIARPGYPLIFGGAFVTAVLALLGMKLPALIGLAVTIWICWFFRDPDRVIPTAEGAIVSPADGKVIVARKEEKNPYISGPCLKISVFMNLFNVHVNRIPHDGEVERIAYFPGKFLAADNRQATEKNERNAVVIRMKSGKSMAVVQVAGLVARRIICGLQVEQPVRRGQRFGMICFGSRLDLYLPVDTELNVSRGEKTKAGATILGYLK